MEKRPAPKPNASPDAEETVREDLEAEAEWRQLGSTRIVAPEGAPADGKEHTLHEEDTAIVAPRQEPELTVFGDFELLKKLGEGAMGAVYKARQISFNREVALKILFDHVANNPKLVDRLNREGRVMGRLDHPNIVQGLAVDQVDGRPYVAMEYVDGESLQKLLNRVGRLDLPDAIHITLAVARALEYAHQEGLVHRDIKPDNVLITRKGVIKVADFGMVKTADEDMHLTQTGHAVGTPWYMPLEQARNAKDTDGRCDIYALGCMLYCMITGNPPFVGKTIVEVIQAKEQGTFPPARSGNPEVPERLDLVIAKMTAKLPKYRYQTCGELIRDLESLNLAGEKLQLSAGKTVVKRRTGLGKEAAQSMEGTIDVKPDVWYVRMSHADGSSTVSKLSTAQVKQMLDDGSLKPTARASHQRNEGYRALATYMEFQGSALSRVSKQAADAQGARFRSLMKRIEEKDKARSEKEKSAERRMTNAADWQTLWFPSVCIAGGLLVLFLLWYIVSGLLN